MSDDAQNAVVAIQKQHKGFQKGKSGNPAGRKPGSGKQREALLKAIAEVETEKGKKLFKHFVEMAYEDKGVLIALMKKVVADKRDLTVAGDNDRPITVMSLGDIARCLQPTQE